MRVARVVALLLALASSRAVAATLDLSGGVLTYTAASGVVNTLTVTLSGGTYTVDDPGEVAISLSTAALVAGCVNVDANTAVCPRSAISSWNIQLGDQSDSANLAAVLEPTTIRGGTGNDLLVGGAGPDNFTWVPGDASDTINGGPGTDTLTFSGANVNENISIGALPGGFRVDRDIGAVDVQATGIEALNIQASGGDDTVSTVPLAGTSQTIDGGTQTATDTLNYDAGGLCTTSTAGMLQSLGAQPVTYTGFEAVNLLNQCTAFPAALDIGAGVLGYTAGNGAANALTVSLSAGLYTIDDTGVPAITLGSGATAAGCVNLDANTAQCPQSAISSWNVQLGDQADSANLSAVQEPTTIRGGIGNDILVGGSGPDTFTWFPGDGSDTINGGPGVDTLAFSGANINEVFTISALPGGFRLDRNVAAIDLQVIGVEALTLQALGGDDTVNTVPLGLTSQTFDGGVQTAADVLSYDAGGACTTQGSGSFQSSGARPVSFVGFENVSLLNQCANPIPIPALGVALRGVLAALLGAVALRLAQARARG